MKPGGTLVFPHVPKCGGTSLKLQIEQSNLKTFIDYDAPPGITKWARTHCDRRNAECNLLDFGSFDIVFGHFPVERYVNRDYRYIALVRDPYSRIVSQLNYLFFRVANASGAGAGANAMAKLLHSGELTPSGWVEKSGARQMYRLYLSRWPRERFALIGDTSRYGEFLERLGCMLGIALDSGVRERESAGSTLEITPEEERKIRALLKDEFEWYKEFVS